MFHQSHVLVDDSVLLGFFINRLTMLTKFSLFFFFLEKITKQTTNQTKPKLVLTALYPRKSSIYFRKQGYFTQDVIVRYHMYQPKSLNLIG